MACVFGTGDADERLADGALANNPLRPTVDKILAKTPGAQLKYISDVIKFDRVKYRQRDRVLMLTSTSLYIIDPKKRTVLL